MERPAYYPDIIQKEVQIRFGINYSEPYQEDSVYKSLLPYSVICVFLEFQDASSGVDLKPR